MSALTIFALLVVLGLLVWGGVRVYRAARAASQHDKPKPERTGEATEAEELLGFQRRIIAWNGSFMRRVAVGLIVLSGLILLSLAASVLLWGQQRSDDRAQLQQVQTNERVLRELAQARRREAVDLEDRRKRAAATDRQQCEDIERLKSQARTSAREGRSTIRALRGLPKDDVQRLLEASRRSERRFGPRKVKTRDGSLLVGIAACSSLPNSTGNG